MRAATSHYERTRTKKTKDVPHLGRPLRDGGHGGLVPKFLLDLGLFRHEEAYVAALEALGGLRRLPELPRGTAVVSPLPLAAAASGLLAGTRRFDQSAVTDVFVVVIIMMEVVVSFLFANFFVLDAVVKSKRLVVLFSKAKKIEFRRLRRVMFFCACQLSRIMIDESK